MMTTHSEQLSITIPITTVSEQIAQRFVQMCPFADKAEQIRQNTLAVCAVDAYLQMMAIESDVAGADSWNSMMQAMANVADLPLPGVGVLSCRVATENEGVCYVPPEEWTGRFGYVAVALDEAAREARLIGFVRSVEETEQVPLSSFGAIEGLVDEVYRLQVANDSVVAREARGVDRLVDSGRSALTRLGEWVDEVMSGGWQAADELVNPSEMSFAFRTAGLAEPAATTEVSRAKLIDLGLQLGQLVRVALVVHISQVVVDETDLSSEDDVSRRDIVLQIRPFGDSPYLVENLVMTVLDEEDVPLMSVTSRDIDNYIQLRLSGETGEFFKVRVMMGEMAFEERFVI